MGWWTELWGPVAVQLAPVDCDFKTDYGFVMVMIMMIGSMIMMNIL